MKYKKIHDDIKLLKEKATTTLIKDWHRNGLVDDVNNFREEIHKIQKELEEVFTIVIQATTKLMNESNLQEQMTARNRVRAGRIRAAWLAMPSNTDVRVQFIINNLKAEKIKIPRSTLINYLKEDKHFVVVGGGWYRRIEGVFDNEI